MDAKTLKRRRSEKLREFLERNLSSSSSHASKTKKRPGRLLVGETLSLANKTAVDERLLSLERAHQKDNIKALANFHRKTISHKRRTALGLRKPLKGLRAPLDSASLLAVGGLFQSQFASQYEFLRKKNEHDIETMRFQALQRCDLIGSTLSVVDGPNAGLCGVVLSETRTNFHMLIDHPTVKKLKIIRKQNASFRCSLGDVPTLDVTFLGVHRP